VDLVFCLPEKYQFRALEKFKEWMIESIEERREKFIKEQNEKLLIEEDRSIQKMRVDLGPVQVSVLKALIDIGGEGTVKELALILGKTSDQVRHALYLLKNKGLVGRERKGRYFVKNVIKVEK